MSKTISAGRMARHIQRLSEAVELLRKPHAQRTDEDVGRARGLVSVTRDFLLEDSISDLLVEETAA